MVSYQKERFPSLKEARARCAEIKDEGQAVGIYKGHRGYVVLVGDPTAEIKMARAVLTPLWGGSSAKQ